MAGQATPRALLLDCLGTLVRLEPPAPLLRSALRERLGAEVAPAAAEAAVRAEIEYYRAHLHEGVDAPALADLRARCAAVVQEALALDASPEAVLAALMDALCFTPFDDVAPALAGLRARGVRLVVVSNWDVSLHEVLARTGLDALVDGAVASASVGAAKPDPAPVRRGLELAGVRAQQAWLVGDTPEADVAGAIAAGVRPVLVDRDGTLEPPPGVAVIPTLAGLACLM